MAVPILSVLLTKTDLVKPQVLSATGEGRHTTVRRELIVLGGGTLVIDNPETRGRKPNRCSQGAKGPYRESRFHPRKVPFQDSASILL